MQATQTTLRSRLELKKTAERKSLKDYLAKAVTRKARRLVFYTHDLGAPLDNLTRDDYYSESVA